MRTLDITFTPDTTELTLWDTVSRQRLLIIPDAALFCPVFNGPDASVGPADMQVSDDAIVITRPLAGADGFRVETKCHDDVLDISVSFTASRRLELNRLDLFPAGTIVNLYDLVNYRNRHHTPATWPELPLGGSGFATDTYSRDWQFAPHPSLFVLRKNDINLLVGALDLPKSTFGMFLSVKDYVTQDWYLSYGRPGYGLVLEPGQTFRSPLFRLCLERGRTVRQSIERYATALCREGFAGDPANRKRFPWHTEPVYCTWLDQVGLAESTKRRAPAVLDEKLVRRVARFIREQKLPFRTIIIDDGWQKARGHWEPDPAKFPDMRRLVDELHALDFKVVLWWAWAELADEVPVDVRFLIADGKRNCHGRRMWDYSNPLTQREYLAPLFGRFFSSVPGCFDVDGIKTDFMADKVHDDMPPVDPDWRGEENYFHKLYTLTDKLMRGHKPDACHHAYAGHPHLTALIDVNRTADVASSNVLEHVNRAAMLAATAPGCPIAYDFHNFLENLDDYFRAAHAGGHPIMVSNLLYTKQDMAAPWQPAEPGYYEVLRRNLR
jgi:hypothetical protein